MTSRLRFMNARWLSRQAPSTRAWVMNISRANVVAVRFAPKPALACALAPAAAAIADCDQSFPSTVSPSEANGIWRSATRVRP